MLELRDYQRDAVRAVIQYFRKMADPALLVLPTGAGKSLVIAELAKLAKGKVLVLAHVKELVEQNYLKYRLYQLDASIFAAGLGQKDVQHPVVFASVQSVHRNLTAFAEQYSLLVIDECHRVSDDETSSYRQVISHLQQVNPGLKVLGMTATPYRLGTGFQYQYHYQGRLGADQPRFFRWCIFELPIAHLLARGYLTPAKKLDCALLSYDFAGLTPQGNGHYREQDLDLVIDKAKRVTPQIIAQVAQYGLTRRGVMIFAATTRHAKEIASYLPQETTGIVLGDTPAKERAEIIEQFKRQHLKFLVNVSVLTTGFDAPHVDLIAILRPTESISLYQQIVGRGLRLAPDKQDCLVLDYAGNPYDLYQPEIGSPPKTGNYQQVQVVCPLCRFSNSFWGKADAKGVVLEHFGRRCQGLVMDQQQPSPCGYRFRARFCPECGAEHDITARLCRRCDTVLVDPDKKLQEALNLKDCLVVYPDRMELTLHQGQLQISYGVGDQWFRQWHAATTPAALKRLTQVFFAPHLIDRHHVFKARTIEQLLSQQHRLAPPAALVLVKDGRFWRVRERLFDLTTNNS